MESEILQLIKKEVEKIRLPDLDQMDENSLKKYILEHSPIKERLKLLINCIYLAVQQSYKDSDEEGDFHRFYLVEGTIKFKDEEDFYRFYPNDTVKKLLAQVNRGETTKLKTFLSTKFYKILEYLYNKEINGYEEAEDKIKKLPPKVIELIASEEREKLHLKFKKEISILKSDNEKKEEEIKLLNEDKEELSNMVDQLQEQLNLYNARYGKL